MTPHGRIDQVFTNLMRDSKDSFSKGYYAVAYHALAGAFHCAEGLDDLLRLHAVESELQYQQHWIATHDSGHTLSVQSAAARGNRDVYGSLLVQVAALRARLKTQRLIKHQQQSAA